MQSDCESIAIANVLVAIKKQLVLHYLDKVINYLLINEKEIIIIDKFIERCYYDKKNRLERR